MLRDHPHVGQYGERIGVAGPTRDDMKMQVLFDPRAGDPSEVQTDEETLRMQDLLEDSDGLLDG